MHALYTVYHVTKQHAYYPQLQWNTAVPRKLFLGLKKGHIFSLQGTWSAFLSHNPIKLSSFSVVYHLWPVELTMCVCGGEWLYSAACFFFMHFRGRILSTVPTGCMHGFSMSTHLHNCTDSSLGAKNNSCTIKTIMTPSVCECVYKYYCRRFLLVVFCCHSKTP